MRNGFNIFALVVVKNEDDIIIKTIEKATKWASKIFVMDNMSSDHTWQKLLDVCAKHDNVVLWGQYGGKFNEGLRQVLFNEYKHLANQNDWWCRLDGDEFYIDDPKEFISKISEKVDHIYNASFQYYLTDDNLNHTEKEQDNFEVNLKWYKCNHSEIRFVKNKKTICWLQGEGWPCNLILPHKERIRLKHYQYRSVKQVKERLNLRSEKLIGDTFKHEIVPVNTWFTRRGFSIPEDQFAADLRVVLKSDLECSNSYVFDDTKLPPIIYSGFKKRIKCIVIYIYMRLLNKKMFKL